ncbi:hypothetical protein L596_014717 [Steinernema carpocapsae]|uniref:Uncharacterized protein n=1 Tax=Steinernema carpocapsae TaxID=34508 RepID=A0A4U5NDN1_STECR|nr:hypothetical protein L596_014717 [Steinernema carpocapsae]
MEDEAKLDDGQLRVQIGMRRRSTSVSEDYSVQKTNDDATECKFSAVKLNYWEDEFLSRFVHAQTPSELYRDPEICRGYWARVSGVTSIVKQFIELRDCESRIVRSNRQPWMRLRHSILAPEEGGKEVLPLRGRRLQLRDSEED